MSGDGPGGAGPGEPSPARYARQTMLAGWGAEGQARLARARVAVVGAGGLGSPVLLYLAAAGVGEIAVCDSDVVEASNLNRQVLHGDADLGERKAVSAARALRRTNPAVRVEAVSERLDASNVARIVGRADVMVDCLDSYESRAVLNAHAVRTGVPLVHGAVRGMMGQVTFLRPPATPCLRCLFPEAPPPEVPPVVGPAPGAIGALQAMEVLKFLTGIGERLEGRLLILDGETMRCRVVSFRRSPGCPACGGAEGAPTA